MNKFDCKLFHIENSVRQNQYPISNRFDSCQCLRCGFYVRLAWVSEIRGIQKLTVPGADGLGNMSLEF